MKAEDLPERCRRQLVADERTPSQTFSRRFVLPYPPTLNHLYATVRGRRVLSSKGRAYKGTVARMLPRDLVPGEVSLRLRFFRPRKAGDLDNLTKALLDSLTGIAYEDDSQVVEIHSTRHEDKLNPRVECVVCRASP